MADPKTAPASPDVTPSANPAAGASPAPPKNVGGAQPGRATTCAQCGKRLDRKKQYYRNGRYFCNKRCWHTSALGVPPQPTTS